MYKRSKKRNDNQTILKAQFFGETPNKEARIKLTQLNTGKSKYINYYDSDLDVLETVCTYLDNIKDVSNYCLLVDNTNNYYQFAIDTQNSSFPELINL